MTPKKYDDSSEAGARVTYLHRIADGDGLFMFLLLNSGRVLSEISFDRNTYKREKAHLLHCKKREKHDRRI